jgi:hypothetical protein
LKGNSARNDFFSLFLEEFDENLINCFCRFGQAAGNFRNRLLVLGYDEVLLIKERVDQNRVSALIVEDPRIFVLNNLVLE